jgi:hypothetical protein
VPTRSARAAGLGLLLLAIAGAVSAWQAAGQNQAGVVVRFDNGRTVSRCVAFDEPTISGFELLDRSGLAVIADIGAQGGLVCSVEGTGCPASDCWCQCQGGATCVYWSYWHLAGDAWRYAQIGATQTMVKPGSVDGWSWGPGTVDAAVAPPATTFAEVCPEPAAEALTASPGLPVDGGSPGQLMAFAAVLAILLAAGVVVWRGRR